MKNMILVALLAAMAAFGIAAAACGDSKPAENPTNTAGSGSASAAPAETHAPAGH